MGEGANYVIRSEKGNTIYYNHWGANSMVADIYLGEKRFTTYVKECDVVEYLTDQPWIEGCAIIDETDRTVWLWQHRLEQGSSVTERVLNLLRGQWPGWKVNLMAHEMYDAERILQVDYMSRQEPPSINTKATLEEIMAEPEDWGRNFVIIKRDGEIKGVRTGNLWLEGIVEYGAEIADPLWTKDAYPWPAEADEYSCIYIDLDSWQLVLGNIAAQLWENHSEKWPGYTFDMGRYGYLEMLRKAGIAIAGLELPEAQVREQVSELLQQHESIDVNSLANAITEQVGSDNVQFNPHFLDTRKPRPTMLERIKMQLRKWAGGK